MNTYINRYINKFNYANYKKYINKYGIDPWSLLSLQFDIWTVTIVRAVLRTSASNRGGWGEWAVGQPRGIRSVGYFKQNPVAMSG